MEIDNINVHDVPELADIWNSCFPEAALSPSTLRKQVYSQFKIEERDIFCIREENRINGFSIATGRHIPHSSRKPPPGCIPVIAVRKNARGQGAARALLDKSEKHLASGGAARARIGYPTYLRGTVLSRIGVSIERTGAVNFYQESGYAPRAAIDSMVFDIKGIREPGKNTGVPVRDVSFEALNPEEKNDFLLFMADEFPGGWHEQFLHLDDLNLLNCGEVLVMKRSKKISGFAGPFSIAECGDTCGIGLGIARDLRGKGLGLALLEGIIGFVRSAGGKKITLFGAVDKINFYGKAGFVPGPVYLVMEKDLKRSS